MPETDLWRLETAYNNLSNKFLVKSCDYQKQFSHIYAFRLTEMTKLLTIKAQQKWGDKYPILKLCELREESNEACIIIGTIFKHQAYKPSILREISEENQLAPQPQRQHYAEPQDKLILEDELQRVRLHGKVNGRNMATGVVCAVLGTIEENGRFEVEDLIYYESGPQKTFNLNVELMKQRYLVLISGLDQTESHNFVDSLNLFQHWLSGNFISSRNKAKQLVRLIVAGNSVRSSSELKVVPLQTRNSAEPSNTLEAVCELDQWFAKWSSTIPVDVMPGEFDPANFMLPQQPFHQCMFPKATANSSFSCVTNPHACEIDDILIVGCSGQNVKDILRTTLISDPIEALRSTLIWSHIAPTSPDTLGCYPYVDNDPFIMQHCPHVYFVGNCDDFQTDVHVGSDGQHTRIVCVPSFARTQCVAAVNLDTLECHKVSFILSE